MYSIDKYNELHINMTSRRYKSVSNRPQISLLPPSIEDYVNETNPVRAIDAYVDSLDLAKQGFLIPQAAFAQDNRPIHLKPCSSCTFMATSTKSVAVADWKMKPIATWKSSG